VDFGLVLFHLFFQFLLFRGRSLCTGDRNESEHDRDYESGMSKFASHCVSDSLEFDRSTACDFQRAAIASSDVRAPSLIFEMSTVERVAGAVDREFAVVEWP